MFHSALRVVRPAAIVSRSALKPVHSPAVRALSTSITRRSGGHGPAATLYGPGAQPGEVPTDEQQATGLERLQVLGKIEGVEAFDTQPLDSSRLGTLDDPIRVPSLDIERIIGCTGSPADSHNLIWFKVVEEKKSRCSECGSVYTLDFQGEHEPLAHAHH